MKTRILLCDDNELVLQNTRSMLDSLPDFQVVGVARTGRAAVEMARDLSPDIVSMDVVMPGMNGIEATRNIIGHSPAIKVLALSMHANRQFAKAMLEAGASGYLLKGCSTDELNDALRALLSGRTYLSPEINGILNPQKIPEKKEIKKGRERA